MHILCPHCQSPIELVEAPTGEEVACPSCGSSFRFERGSTQASSVGRGQKVGRFELLAVVGVGAFGTVYRARDPELDRVVAVKVPRAGNLAGPEELDRFLREARSVAQLRHPSIVAVHEVGQADRLPYLVSDFLEGVTLADLLSARRPPPAEAARLVAAVADALQYAHDQGVVHRDVKPSNIMIGVDGTPHLMDFGLAKRDAGEVTMTVDGQILGSPAYMSPEQARGDAHQVDGRSDVYSLGVVFYQLLTGELPFRGTTRMLLHQVLHEEPRAPRTLNDKIPRDLQTICLKAMAKEPGRRYATAAAFAEDMRCFLGGKPIQARPMGSVERVWRWTRRNPALAGLTAAVVLILLTGTAVSTAFWLEAARRADDANREQERANREAATAIAQATRADQNAEDAKRHLYAAHLNLAGLAWRDGQARRMLTFLNYHLPRPAGEDPRGFEWHYLHRLAHQDMRTLPGYSAAFSRTNPSWVAVHNQDDAVVLWDFVQEQRLRTIPSPQRAVFDLEFAPDGTHLVTVGEQGAVKLWDMTTGQLVRDYQGHTGDVWSAAFDPDGRRLATQADRGVIVWEVATGEPLLTVMGNFLFNRSGVAFHPNRQMLAVAAYNDRVNSIDLWSLADQKQIRSIRSPGNKEVSSVSFGSDGRLVAAYFGGAVRVWDPRSGQELLTVQAHQRIARDACFSPDGKRIASGGDDATVRLWDASAGGELLTLHGHLGYVQQVRFSADGRRLVSAGPETKIWDLVGDSQLRVIQGRLLKGLAFSPAGNVLAAHVDLPTSGALKSWDLITGQEVGSFAHKGIISPVGFHADGRRLVCAYPGNDASKVVQLWDMTTDRMLHTLEGHTDLVTKARFSPDARWLASASFDNTMRLWDTATGQLVHTLERPSRRGIGPLVFSPDGTRVATASPEAVVNVWDTATGVATLLLQAQQNEVTDLAFTRDNRRLATAGFDDTIRIWDAVDGRLLHILQGHNNTVDGVAYSPDGERLASASRDGTVKIWDPTSGQELLTLSGSLDRGAPMEHGRQVVFSPDGRWLASCSWDGPIRVWDARPLTPEVRQEREALAAFHWYRAQSPSKETLAQRLRADPTLAQPVRANALSLLALFQAGGPAAPVK